MNQNIWCIEIQENIYCLANLLLLEPKHMMYWNSIPLSMFQEIFLLEPKHMMYWNDATKAQRRKNSDLEPKHMMYWNLLNSKLLAIKFVLEPKHMMYWNVLPNLGGRLIISLNQNIWCIEILYNYGYEHCCYSWTKTYDVLKWD